jgi:hypothetical protein
MVTSPNVQSDIAAIAEFEKQDWIQDILKANPAGQQDNKKMYVNPNVAFPLQDNFSVGTIHGANVTKSLAAPTSEITAPNGSAAAGLPCNQNATIEILDNDAEDDVSVLTTKTQEELVALLVKDRRQMYASTGSWVASGSGIPSGSGPVATLPPSNAGCQQTAPTNNAASDVSGVAVNGEVSNGPSGK